MIGVLPTAPFQLHPRLLLHLLKALTHSREGLIRRGAVIGEFLDGSPLTAKMFEVGLLVLIALLAKQFESGIIVEGTLDLPFLTRTENCVR